MSSKLVLGEGSKNPKIIFVGEAPGKEEEKKGRPFVGRAGRLLRKTITESGVNIKDCYITNVVKVRPMDEEGGNRTPDKKEIKKFLPILRKELQKFPSALIVLLGNTALQALLAGQGLKIARNHGIFTAKNERLYYITYHPSAALRFQKNLKIFKGDIARLKSFI